MPVSRIELAARIVGDIDDDEVRTERRVDLERRANVVFDHHVRPQQRDADEGHVMPSDFDFDRWRDVDVELPRFWHVATLGSVPLRVHSAVSKAAGFRFERSG